MSDRTQHRLTRFGAPFRLGSTSHGEDGMQSAAGTRYLAAQSTRPSRPRHHRAGPSELARMPPAMIDPVTARLMHFRGVVTLEVFETTNFFSSRAALLDSVSRVEAWVNWC
jgi:hypothetical protein